MTMHHIREVIPARPPNDEERAILNRLLSTPFPGRDELLRQANSVKVSNECDCCPTITLMVDRLPLNKAEVKRRIPVEAEGVDQDGNTIHYLLHVIEGYLSELEVYREDSYCIRNLPNPDSLKLICLDTEKA